MERATWSEAASRPPQRTRRRPWRGRAPPRRLSAPPPRPPPQLGPVEERLVDLVRVGAAEHDRIEAERGELVEQALEPRLVCDAPLPRLSRPHPHPPAPPAG